MKQVKGLKRTILSILLSFLMVAGTLSALPGMQVYADDNDPRIYIHGINIMKAENKTITDSQGGTAVYDPQTNTLKLTNFKFTQENVTQENVEEKVLITVPIYSLNDLVIELDGDNILTAKDNPYGISHGICVDGKLTITGNGTLTVNNESTETETNSCGINCKEFIVTGGSTVITKGGTGAVSMGVWCEELADRGLYGDITVSKGSKLIANGGTASQSSLGISSRGNIFIDGEVTARGDSYGVLSPKNIKINGSLCASGSERALQAATLEAYGLFIEAGDNEKSATDVTSDDFMSNMMFIKYKYVSISPNKVNKLILVPNYDGGTATSIPYTNSDFLNDVKTAADTIAKTQREGYYFFGWYEKDSSTGELKTTAFDFDSFDKDAMTENVTVYAKWVQEKAKVKTLPTANDLTYNGQAQALVTAGESDGEMQYALGTDGSSVPAEGWNKSIPTGTKAGTYYVWYKAVGTNNRADSDPQVITVQIRKCKHTKFEIRGAVDPTCTDKGYEGDKYCLDCGTLLEKGNEIAATGHEYGGSGSGSGSSGGSDYSSEWVNGKWYNADGTQTYEPTLSWKCNSTGWWVEDTNGWYPFGMWQKIDGKWYYFNADGYMASNEWVDGCWLSENGAWEYEYTGRWKTNGTGWWFEDETGWYPVSQWQKINGNWYYFGSDGIMLTNQYIGDYWVGSDGSCQ